eukprot:sb/3468066/
MLLWPLIEVVLGPLDMCSLLLLSDHISRNYSTSSEPRLCQYHISHSVTCLPHQSIIIMGVVIKRTTRRSRVCFKTPYMRRTQWVRYVLTGLKPHILFIYFEHYIVTSIQLESQKTYCVFLNDRDCSNRHCVKKSSNFHNMFIRQFTNFWLLGNSTSKTLVTQFPLHCGHAKTCLTFAMPYVGVTYQVTKRVSMFFGTPIAWFLFDNPPGFAGWFFSLLLNNTELVTMGALKCIAYYFFCNKIYVLFIRTAGKRKTNFIHYYAANKQSTDLYSLC